MRKEGNSAIYTTTGNNACHVILRGGKRPNFDRWSIDSTAAELTAAGPCRPASWWISATPTAEKQHKNQLQVGADICSQVQDGDGRIFGVMIESHLQEGRQDAQPGQALVYGQSITDACLGWDDSEELIGSLAAASRAPPRRAQTGLPGQKK